MTPSLSVADWSEWRKITRDRVFFYDETPAWALQYGFQMVAGKPARGVMAGRDCYPKGEYSDCAVLRCPCFQEARF